MKDIIEAAGKLLEASDADAAVAIVEEYPGLKTVTDVFVKADAVYAKIDRNSVLLPGLAAENAEKLLIMLKRGGSTIPAVKDPFADQ